jgi:lysozyme
MNVEAFIQQLEPEEGFRLKVYNDSRGIPTIGYGRNLRDVGISAEEAVLMLNNDIARTTSDMDRLLPWWASLSEVRQRVLADMCFNMGTAEVATHWPIFQQQLRAGKFDEAADNMRRSLWATQVGPRARKLADMMQYDKESTG